MSYYPLGRVPAPVLKCPSPFRTHHENGKLKSEHWFDDDGHYHREDGPAQIYYFDTGIVKSESWAIHGDVTGLAYREYHENGQLREEHKITDHPFSEVTYFLSTNQKLRHTWRWHSVPHRTYGPASILYSVPRFGGTNIIEIPEYYLFGVEVTKEEHKRLCKLPSIEILMELFRTATPGGKEDIAWVMKKIDPQLSKNLNAVCQLE